MKTYNDNHNYLIESRFELEDKEAKHGSMSNHRRKVSFVTFLYRQRDGSLLEVNIHKNTIIELFNEIQEQEKETKEIEVIDIPF